MDTTRNRAAVLAQFLRASVREIRTLEKRVDEDAVLARRFALESVDAVAEELELVAITPVPPRPQPAPPVREDRRKTRDELPPDLPRTVPAERTSAEAYYEHREAQLAAPNPAGEPMTLPRTPRT